MRQVRRDPSSHALGPAWVCGSRGKGYRVTVTAAVLYAVLVVGAGPEQHAASNAAVTQVTASYPPAPAAAYGSPYAVAPPPGYVPIDGMMQPNPELYGEAYRPEPPIFDPLNTGFNGRFQYQYWTEGMGYDEGFSSFEGFLPLGGDPCQTFAGFQGNVLVDNEGDFGFNAGVLYRSYVAEWDRTLGGYLFLDNRRESGTTFNQIGFGLETLGRSWDARTNVYIPVGDTRSGALSLVVLDTEFVGRSILLTQRARYAEAMTGLESEIGGPLPWMGDVLRGYLGGYFFNSDHGGDDAWGPMGRLEARLDDNVTLNVAVTHDDVFNTNVFFGAALYLPGYLPAPKRAIPEPWARLAEPVFRRHNIVVQRRKVTELAVAQNPGGQRIDVVHVNSAAAAGGTGSVTAPFQTLAQAQAAATPGDIIFGHANSVFDAQSIVLQANQQLLGEGIEHIIATRTQDIVLPTATDPELIQDVPLIVNAPGNAVTLASGSTVAGWRIENAGARAVFGSGVGNVRVDHNVLEGNEAGVRLINIGGTNRITNNMINANRTEGIEIGTVGTNVATVVVEGNTLVNNDEEAIDVITTANSRLTLLVDRNTIRVGIPADTIDREPLVKVRTRDASVLSARFQENQIEDIAQEAGDQNSRDVYFDQILIDAGNNSQAFLGFYDNELASNREFLDDSARNGPFGIDAEAWEVARLGIRLADNSSTLNYAFSEVDLSIVQIEGESLGTNTGQFFYWPSALNFEFVESGSLPIIEAFENE